MPTFYNEIDGYCCDWLQNLMDAGLISPGKIDDRSIEDITPDDLKDYERCHFFAGIAGWELALQMSGYDGPVWTGSCPCQPFSSAGKQQGQADKRHLWPVWSELIRVCRPPTIFGEQVEAAIGWGWLDLVSSDLEAEGYTVGAAVLPACSVGAPHVRRRLWFVADSRSENVARPVKKREGLCKVQRKTSAKRSDNGLHAWVSKPSNSPTCVGFDGLSRPVGIMRAAGNAIVPQVAAAFIKATM